MKKGFSVFLVKTIILWVIIIGLLIMMFFKSENEVTNPLQTIGLILGVGIIVTIVYLLGSRCPKCGQWFAMGKTSAERIQIGVKSKTKGTSRSKFGLGAILAFFDYRYWWLGLRSGGTNYNSTTDSKAIYGLKKTRFCLECGYEQIKMPK
jgi:hypothetical protein